MVMKEERKIPLHSTGCSLEGKKGGAKTCCLLAGVAEKRQETGKKNQNCSTSTGWHNITALTEGEGSTGMLREVSSLFNPPALSMLQFLTRVCSSVVCVSCWVLMTLHVT